MLCSFTFLCHVRAAHISLYCIHITNLIMFYSSVSSVCRHWAGHARAQKPKRRLYASPQPRAHTPAHRRACAFRVVRECDAILINLIKRESQACLAEGEGVGRRFYR